MVDTNIRRLGDTKDIRIRYTKGVRDHEEHKRGRQHKMARKTAATAPITNDDLALARHLLATMTNDQISESDQWYADARQLCEQWAAQSGYTLEQCAAVMALCSINASWAGNVTLARKALLHGEIEGLPIKVKNVTAILQGAPIEDHLTNGSKVRNFYRSILLQDSCTVDRWVFRVFGKPQGETWYPWVERAVRQLAAEYGLPAFMLQARLWVAIMAVWEA